MNKSILITGANSGLGKDTARQLGLIKETEKIYLACRNELKAKAAKADLEKTTGRS
ncbi:MAG: NAD(P)-dependent dehydrogenase (short-subunit alcohol dehydrogenase family), partial [Arcticibacterium sp.]